MSKCMFGAVTSVQEALHGLTLFARVYRPTGRVGESQLEGPPQLLDHRLNFEYLPDMPVSAETAARSEVPPNVSRLSRCYWTGSHIDFNAQQDKVVDEHSRPGDFGHPGQPHLPSETVEPTQVTAASQQGA